MKCNKCGKEIVENSKFCSGCGTAIEEKTYGNYRALLLILVFVAKIIQVASTIFINGNLSLQGDDTLATGLGNMFTALVSIPLMAFFIITTFIILLVIVIVWTGNKKKITTGNIIGLVILYVLNLIPVIAITLS